MTRARRRSTKNMLRVIGGTCLAIGVTIATSAQTSSAGPPAKDAAAESQSTPATPAPSSPTQPPAVERAPFTLAQLAWLEGCWRGEVNEREYREHWLPLRGDLMVGVSHTVMAGKTQSYEYLRLEPRADGIYYVNDAMAPGKPETAYKLTEHKMDREDEVFTFVNTVPQFPQRLSYRRGIKGWLYATVEGEIGGASRQVIYPMHRIDCKTGQGVTE